MWTDGKGFFYSGDCRTGDREATAEEVAALEKERDKLNAQAQVDQIERETMMNRAIREMAIGIAEEKAAALGMTPEQLYKVNLGYQKVKDVENEIVALRAKL